MTTKRSFSELVNTWANIFKAIPSEQLDDLKRVEDLWSEPGGQFASPSRAEIKTGSPQESSGGGAERMVREYSDPAPQMGLMEEYQKFSAILRDFGKAVDHVLATQKTQGGRIEAMASFLSSAAEKAQSGAPPKRTAEGDGIESCIDKAESKLRKARAELRKADMADDDCADEREEKKSNIEAARVALKAAKRFLAKAEDEDQDEWPDSKEESAEKARREFARLTKALKKAEEDEVASEEAEKARAQASATAKAEAEQAEAAKAAPAPQVKAEGEADPECEDAEKAKKAVEAPAAKSADFAPVDPALRDQIQVMSTTLKGLMETVMGASKGNSVPPTFAKAMPVVALTEKVEAAIENGTLESPMEIMKAHTLVTHIRAVQDGKMDSAIVDDEIAKAPDNVRALFTAQAA